MSYTSPSIADFKSYFNRDFPYGATTATIMDADLTKAMDECADTINPGLFPTQGSYNIGFLNLSAHNLVMAIRASGQGIAGNYSWMETSKSVGSVSSGYTIPQRILDNPYFAMLAKTNYGAKYLMMILPKLSGQMFIVEGATQA